MSLPRYPNYKDSGVEWLGEVPGHWETKRIRFVAQLNPSKSEISQLDRDTVVSFLPMDAIGEDGSLNLDKEKPISEVENGYTYFRNGDVTVAKITPCYENGKGALMQGLLNGVGFGTTELIVARPKPEEVTGAYLHYLFISPDFRALGESCMYGAGGQKRVPDDFVRNFATAFPPLPEQTQIAAFLDRETAKIDGLVAEQRRLMELLKEKRQAVISHAVTQGVNPDATMKPSGIEWLGDVPAHWSVCSIRRVVSAIEQGWSPECFSRPADENEWGVLKAGCVNRGLYDQQENKALPAELLPIPEYEVRVGDVLMSRANGSPELVGSTALITSTREKLMLSDKIFRLRFESQIEPEFFVAALNSRPLRSQIEQALSGGNGLANNLPQSSLLSFFLCVPPVVEQKLICIFLKSELCKFDTLTTEAQHAIDLLQERRTALISAAVTGQIDVRGAVAA
ncbi:MAG: restriction endonuclease subunit S [Polaromonas sp.]